MSAKRQPPSRDRLITAAAKLFYHQGIHKTSVDAVVAEAGLTKPTLYQHFPSKDELVAAVAQYRSDNWRAAIEERVEAATNPMDRLLAVFDFLDDFLAGRPFRGCALVNTAIEILNPSDPSRTIARRNKEENRQRLQRLAREARLAQPEALAAALSLLFEGAVVTAHVENDPAAGRAAREAAQRLIDSHRP